MVNSAHKNPDAALAAPREALHLIGTTCERYWVGYTCVDNPTLTPDADHTAGRWCDQCISRTALAGEPLRSAPAGT